jgi:3-deoxy-D-manno-octulosonic-acid transferase
MYALYSALLGLFLLLTLPYWLLQMMRYGKYRAGLAQRLGRVPPALAASNQPTIWVHAVSVGEVVAASGVVASLKEKFPSHRVLVSTTTSTRRFLHI